MATAVVDVSKLQDTVTTWTPVAWLNTTCSFGPLARQGSFRAEKSAVETTGGGLEQAGSPALAHMPPRTTLGHVAVRETREVGGGEGKHMTADIQPGPAGLPMTSEEGEAG